MRAEVTKLGNFFIPQFLDFQLSMANLKSLLLYALLIKNYSLLLLIKNYTEKMDLYFSQISIGGYLLILVK